MYTKLYKDSTIMAIVTLKTKQGYQSTTPLIELINTIFYKPKADLQ